MLQFISVNGQALDSFRGLLPAIPLHSHQAVYGCLCDGLPVACGTVTACGRRRTLTWLYVPETLRGNGFGGALLDGICQAVLPTAPEGQLELCYEPEQPWAPQLDAMLACRGGEIRLHTMPSFLVPREGLEASSLLEGVDLNHISAPGIVPLEEVSAQQLRALKSDCELEGAYPISRADFLRADPQRSMVVLYGGEIKGLALVSSLDGRGELNLDLLYLKKAFMAYGLGLLRRTAAACLTHPEGLVRFRFLCAGDPALKLAGKLLGTQYQTSCTVTTAMLSRWLYRPAN